MGALGLGVVVPAVELKTWKADYGRGKWESSAVIPTMLLTPYKIHRVIFAIELR